VLVANAEKKIEERAVRLGIETPTKVEVLSGLQENDLVIVGSRSQLKPGQRVEPKIVEVRNKGEE
jgi:multidrug efflux pump subunit AcrA (membrane-fusion protein)